MKGIKGEIKERLEQKENPFMYTRDKIRIIESVKH